MARKTVFVSDLSGKAILANVDLYSAVVGGRSLDQPEGAYMHGVLTRVGPRP